MAKESFSYRGWNKKTFQMLRKFCDFLIENGLNEEYLKSIPLHEAMLITTEQWCKMLAGTTKNVK